MEENNNKLIIVLRDSNDAQAFTPQNLIHNSEFDRAKKWIKKQAKDAAHALEINSGEYTPKYNTISILGTRGSGKTTFMKSLLKYEWEEEGIQKIGILDPTLIEEKGHPFLTIIAEINRLVISHYDKMDIYNNRLEIPKSLWEEHLKKLSEGLPTLETIEAGFEKWQDPEYIMKIGLKRVKAARDLSQNFHNLLKAALTILKKKAFIIALDDIDVDFLRGWPVLETLRKYLTTPFIITLLSGDLELYSMAIRKQQWKNFGKSLLVNEGEYLKRHHDFDDMVTQMEEQYMLKVLSPNYRIHLRTLLEKKLVETKDTKICIDTSQLIQDTDSKETNTTEQNQEKPIEIEIEVAYQEQLKKLGMENPTEREVYINFLLGMPIRSQIRLLTALYSAKENSIEAWTDIFLSKMYILDADIDLIRAYPAYTTIVMLRFLQSQNLLTRAYKFQPTLQQFNINAVLFALTATFATYSDKHPYLLFDYLIRIGLPLSLQDGGILSAQNIELSSLINFAKLTQERGLSNCCGDIIAYTQGLFKDGKGQLSLSRSLGLLTLAGLAEKAKTNPERNEGRIDYELRSTNSENTITNLQRAVAYLPISISIAPWKQSTIVTASFYRLLACIGEILKRNTINKNNNANTPTDEQISAISSTILDLGSLKTHTIPLFDNSTTDSLTEYSDSEIHEEKIENELDQSFIESVWTWMNSSSCETFSPNIIGRILSRMQRSIPLISNNTDIQNLGDAMHRYIISFFNAVLYETSAETYPDIELNRGNTISNDKILIDNIKQVKKQNKELPPLTKWIFDCPLLLCFLNKDQNKDQTGAIINDENKPPFFLYDRLHKVTLPDRKTKANSGENLQKNIERIYNSIVNSGFNINSREDLKNIESVDWGKKGNDERREIFYKYFNAREENKTHDKAFELAFSNNNDKTNSSK